MNSMLHKLTYRYIQTHSLVLQLVELLKATIARLRDAAQAGGAGSSTGSLEWPDYMTPCLLLLDLLMKPSSMSNGAELQQVDQRGHGTTPAGAAPQDTSSSEILAHGLTAPGGARDGRGAEAKEWKGSGKSRTRSSAREELGDRDTPSWGMKSRGGTVHGMGEAHDSRFSACNSKNGYSNGAILNPSNLGLIVHFQQFQVM